MSISMSRLRANSRKEVYFSKLVKMPLKLEGLQFARKKDQSNRKASRKKLQRKSKTQRSGMRRAAR